MVHTVCGPFSRWLILEEEGKTDSAMFLLLAMQVPLSDLFHVIRKDLPPAVQTWNFVMGKFDFRSLKMCETHPNYS